jgi:peptidoglycan/LPS O-acetylase OafA/YrhL
MVIVFFVLSGFVIAHTHAKRPADWRRFATDRLSRIYSVAIPALLLTALLDQVGSRLAPALYAEQLPPGSYFARMLLGAAFLNQTWGLSSRTGSNGPYWSLSYEFWYYAVFACWVFVRPFGRRLVLVGICVLFAGPKILMLMPVWLCGVAAYVASARRVFPPRIALPVVIATGLMIAFVFHESESWTAVPPLYFSGRAAQDLWPSTYLQ